jgi:hypothetical protein
VTAVSETVSAPSATHTEIVDVDVHERAALEELVPYLAPQWRRYITEFGWQPERLLPYAQPTAGGLDRADAKLPTVAPAGLIWGSSESSCSTSTTSTPPSSPAGSMPPRSAPAGRSSRRG